MKITVSNLNNGSGEVLIYDEIGDSFFGDGITAKQFANDIKSLGDVDEIVVRINSPGGSVVDGLAIYNTLKNHPARISVFIDGVALSMASGIAMAGDEIVMAENALMMIHNPSDLAHGDADEMRRKADILDKVKSSLITSYANRSGKSAEEISALMSSETWFDAQEAVDAGFADRIAEPSQVAARSSFAINKSLKVPAYLGAAISNLFSPPKKVNQMTVENKESKTDPTDATPKAATIIQIRALAGIENVDSDFVLSQLEAGSTLDQARDALATEISNQLKAAKQARADAETEAAKNKSAGVEPLGTNTPDAGDVKPKKPTFQDKIACRNEIMNEMEVRKYSGNFKAFNGSFDHTNAIKDVKRNRPELFELEPAVLQDN